MEWPYPAGSVVSRQRFSAYSLLEWMLAQDREADGGQEDMGAVPEPREKVGIAESGDESGEKICEAQRGFWAHADTFLWILIATALVSGICVLGLLLGL